MSKSKVAEITTKVVELLDPLTPDERKRVINASRTLLGDDANVPQSTDDEHSAGSSGDRDDLKISQGGIKWMKQNSVTIDQLHQVFDLAGPEITITAGEIPGASPKEKTLNVYILEGIRGFLAKETQTIDDASARVLCKSYGCFNQGNHSVYLKAKGNFLSGSKSLGWRITAPGLKHGASIIKELAQKG
jgi:hypothetical protein